MFGQLLGDTAAAVYTTKENLQVYLKLHEWLIIGPLVIRSMVDVIISVTLVYYLVCERTNAYKKTIAVLDKLILWSIETGVIMRYAPKTSKFSCHKSIGATPLARSASCC
ncbi:hypothetical protein GYMLUDRAFT_680256 [Collybiopsis luxurians FD-317 M1]|uniref:Unplaced genomic scaffold GYMLUscaffold_33, whole genome shotgun sequence n=1 Tax=Collybiopsis luxurians FD-317 M1 TaxID=944289 RepID=A0A0D0C9A0_9AGAR|nr:hypothetical protein GYMLUDRAFT_680256 [Collybiopsis luxurians FD-317 M1]